MVKSLRVWENCIPWIKFTPQIELKGGIKPALGSQLGVKWSLNGAQTIDWQIVMNFIYSSSLYGNINSLLYTPNTIWDTDARHAYLKVVGMYGMNSCLKRGIFIFTTKY